MSTYPISGTLPQTAKYIGEFVPDFVTIQYFYRVIAYDRTRIPITSTTSTPVWAFGPEVLDGEHCISISWSPVIGVSFYQVFKSATGDPGSTEPAWWIASGSEVEIVDCGYPEGTRNHDLNPGLSPLFTRSVPCPPGPNPCDDPNATDPCADTPDPCLDTPQTAKAKEMRLLKEEYGLL